MSANPNKKTQIWKSKNKLWRNNMIWLFCGDNHMLDGIWTCVHGRENVIRTSHEGKAAADRSWCNALQKLSETKLRDEFMILDPSAHKSNEETGNKDLHMKDKTWNQCFMINSLISGALCSLFPLRLLTEVSLEQNHFIISSHPFMNFISIIMSLTMWECVCVSVNV